MLNFKDFVYLLALFNPLILIFTLRNLETSSYQIIYDTS